MEHNTLLPTCGMLSEKTEWVVHKAGRYAWCAHRKGELPDIKRFFPTWGEALAYADRMACTTPPRRHKYWHVRRRGNDYAITRYKRDWSSQTIHIAPADLLPLADLLQAAHHHEERGEQ